jgi:hypothetical protein
MGMKTTTITGDEPTREPMSPHAVSWGANYADRDYFSGSKYQSDRGARKRAARKRTAERRPR